MKKKADKEIIGIKKAQKKRKKILRKKTVSKKTVLKRIKIAHEKYSWERKSVRISVSFVIPVKILKMESGARFSRLGGFRKEVFGKKIFCKAVASLLIVAVNWFSIISIVGTDAYFNDVEVSENNLFAATQLDFSINSLMSDGFRTQTQGGWGNGGDKNCVDASSDDEGHNGIGRDNKNCDDKNDSNNPGDYRDAHFDDAFVDGLMVGDEASGYYAHFSSSEAIKNFLPAGKTPGAFSEDHEDPLETEAGVLAGQVVSLALNVGFDEFDPDFGVNEGKLSEFRASDLGTPCEKMAAGEDMTVGEILAEANLILSGQPGGFTPSEMNDCVSEINERFDNGLTKKITPTQSVWRDMAIIKNEGLNFQHGIKAEQASGDADLCEKLTVEAYLNGVLIYFGDLTDLDYKSSVFSDSANKWRLLIRLPSDAPSSIIKKTCGLKYIVSGWQENIAMPGEGFSDVEEFSDSVESGEWESAVEDDVKIDSENDYQDGDKSGMIVMNEFLPNPEGAEYGIDFGKDTSPMPRGEWIELYNNDDKEHDLNGWYFKDYDNHRVEIAVDNVLASTIVPARSWLVAYMNKDLLNNKRSETVTLYDNHDNIMDSYSYSGGDYCSLEPTPGSVNNEVVSDDCSGVPGNKSYARIPDGTGDWFDPIPTPGKANVMPEDLAVAGLGLKSQAADQSNVGFRDESVVAPQKNNSDANVAAGAAILDAAGADDVVSPDSDMAANISDAGSVPADDTAKSGSDADMGTSDAIIDSDTGRDIPVNNPDAVESNGADVSGGRTDSVNDSMGIGATEAAVADNAVTPGDASGGSDIPDDGGQTIQAVSPKDTVAGGETQNQADGDSGV